MPIDPDSIKEIKFKNENEVLETLLSGLSIRKTAGISGVCAKTVHKIRLKHAEKFPKKEKVEHPKEPKVKNIKRWLSVPKRLDDRILFEAGKSGFTWQSMVIAIFNEWYGERDK